jgi:membrane protease subunit HflC
MNRVYLVGTGLLLLLLVIINATLFIVDQRQYAVIFQFGEAKKVIEKPGLNFKIP